MVDGKWSIDSCSKSYSFACQKVPGQCADSWVPYKNKCYLFNSNKQTFTSFYDASTMCANYGARFASIDEYIQF